MKKSTLKQRSGTLIFIKLLKQLHSHLFLTILLFVFTVIGSVNAQSFTINVDFGSDNTPSEGWNNVIEETTEIQSLVNSNGDATEINLSVYDAFNGVNNSGASGTEEIPSLASSDSFYGNTAAFEGASEPTGGVKFTGLAPDVMYNLAILSARSGTTDNRETKFDITGASSSSLSVNSSDNTALVSGSYAPDANGVLTIDVSAGPNNDNSYKFYYLNSIQLSYDVSTSISDLKNTSQKYSFYPNPACDHININATELSEITIFDLSGKMLKCETIFEGNNRVNIDLNSGLYLLQIYESDKLSYSSKFIVE